MHGIKFTPKNLPISFRQPGKQQQKSNGHEDMKSRSKGVPNFIVATAFCFFSVASLATPKAAEHEDAPVTAGANVARPNHSAKPAKQQASANHRKAAKGKSATARSTKKTGAASGKK